MHRRLIGWALIAIVIGGCVESTGPDPEACAAPAVEIELDVAAGAMEPNDPSACRGQAVTLVVTSEVDAVFHVHGYDEEVPATELRAGTETPIEFTAARSGQFPIELHPLDDPSGVEIGVLTVHEP